MQQDTIATRYILYCFDNYGHFVSYIEGLSWHIVHNKRENNYLYLMVNLCVMQWAEVLSADAFSAFEDAGLDNNKVLTVFD